MPGMPASLALGIREAVGGSAIEVHAPVDAGRAHLLFEGRALVGRDERILGADAHEHAALDVLRILGAGGLEPRVEADDRLQVGAAAGELERHRAAEAVADRRDAAGVGVGMREEHVEAALPEAADCGRGRS